MSKHINMTGHYKVAGRDRQGEGILQASQKGAYAQQRHEERLQAIESQAGPPAWETTPPNLEISEKPAPSARKQTSQQRTRRKARSTQSGKTARKAAPGRKTATRKAAPKRKAARVTPRKKQRPSRASARASR